MATQVFPLALQVKLVGQVHEPALPVFVLRHRAHGAQCNFGAAGEGNKRASEHAGMQACPLTYHFPSKLPSSGQDTVHWLFLQSDGHAHVADGSSHKSPTVQGGCRREYGGHGLWGTNQGSKLYRM